jgi:hypothetical protein
MPEPIRLSSPNATPAQLAKLAHLRQISDLWDRAFGIPGTQWRVGIESLIGLLPFGGDFIGLLLSSYIVFQAIKFKLPRTLLLQMIFNIVLDAAAGSVPILGDLFDTTWKANTKNVNLLEAHLRAPATPYKKTDKRLIWLLGGGILLVSVILLTLFMLLINLVVKLMYP